MDEDVRKEISTRLTVAVPTAGRAFGIGRNASYDAARRGDFPTIRIGSAIRVPTAWIRRKLGLETEAA